MGGLLQELRRRKMFRTAAGYLAAAWISFEVVAGIEGPAGLPDWSDSVALIVLVAAFPVALFIAWTFEFTPDGIRRTPPRNASEAEPPPPVRPVDYAVMAAIVLFAGLLAWQPVSRTIRTGAPPLASGDEVNIVTPTDNAAGTETAARADPPELTVAVLPFLAISAEAEDGFFADGLTEEILNSLAALPELRVTSRTSAFQFRGTDLPSIPEIATSLGVAHVLEGSVRRAGDQVRVTAQLIRAADDTHLWSQTYDRPFEDVFAIQEDIASSVADVLQIVLSETNRRQMRNSGTRNIDAFIAYQQGKVLWDRAHEEDETDDLLEQADAYFARATELAPDFSEAYLLQSDWYAHQLAEPRSSGDAAADALALETAQERQAELLARAYETAATDTRRAIVETNQILFSDDWRAARGAIEDAITSRECANDNWLQDFVRIYDNLQHRQAYAERQVQCDPLNPNTRLMYGNTLLDRGEYEAALEWADDLAARELAYESEVIRFDALLGLGRLDEAEALLEAHWEWERIRLAAMRGGEAAETVIRPFASEENTWFDLLMYAYLGEREAANAVAAVIDARPYGYIDLITAIESCRCGSPFDRSATPEFSMRLVQSGFAWPPAGDLGFPGLETDTP
jgi:TolB-like protein